MTNDGWNLVVLWIIEIAESELIIRYSKSSIEYFWLKTDDFSKFGTAYCSNSKLGQALNESEYTLNILIDAFPNNRQHHPEILATKHGIERLKKAKEMSMCALVFCLFFFTQIN